MKYINRKRHVSKRMMRGVAVVGFSLVAMLTSEFKWSDSIEACADTEGLISMEQLKTYEHKVTKEVEVAVADATTNVVDDNDISLTFTTFEHEELLPTDVVIREYGPLTSELFIETNATYVKTINQFFDTYSQQTLDADAVSHVVDIATIRENLGAKNNWISFEGFSESVPNKYAVEEGTGYINKDEIDLANQMYRGRYMVAVGPAVMVSDYCGGFVTASKMLYGTFIDIVIEDTEGERYYIPCVIADCKNHTYPNGYVQTGKAKLRNGSIDNVPECADWSSVEFTTKRLNEDGSSRSEGLSKDYRLVEFIVYNLDASLSEEGEWRNSDLDFGI